MAKDEGSVKFETKTYHEIWYSDLQKAIKSIYDIDVEIAVMLDYPGQDTYYTYTVNGSSEFDDIDDEGIYREWLETGEMTSLGPFPFTWEGKTHYTDGEVQVKHLFHRLFVDGYIPSGEYLLTVHW